MKDEYEEEWDFLRAWAEAINEEYEYYLEEKEHTMIEEVNKLLYINTVVSEDL